MFPAFVREFVDADAVTMDDEEERKKEEEEVTSEAAEEELVGVRSDVALLLIGRPGGVQSVDEGDSLDEC